MMATSRNAYEAAPYQQSKTHHQGTNSTVPWVNNNNNESTIPPPVLNPSDGGGSPPPTKRSRSSELAQNSVISNRFSPSPASSAATTTNNNNNNSHQHHSEARESLLSQALESTHNSISSNNPVKGNSDSSVHAQSTGEESNSSDTGLSERGISERGLSITGMNGPHSMADLIQPKAEPTDYTPDHHNNSLVMDPNRTPNFSAALLGLQGLPGLLPGPSGMHNSGPENSFGPPPKPTCPHCGRVYSSVSNLRQHIVNVHAPAQGWYVCNVCSKQCKTKHYLINHQLQAHGIRQRKSHLPDSPLY